MRLLRFIEFLRARLKAVIWIGYGVLALIVVVDALPFLVDKEHAHTKLEHLPVSGPCSASWPARSSFLFPSGMATRGS
jgi:hypothetical protein